MDTGSAQALTISAQRREKRHDRPVRLRTWLRVWRTFKPLARRHRSKFWASNLAAAFVVGSRLLFPWPLKALLKPWLKAGSILPGIESSVNLDSSWLSNVFLYAGAFLLIVLVFGYADYRQRVWVARFAIGWVRDIRAEAFRAAHKLGGTGTSVRSGDIVSRLVGDTARLKAGLKGFLVHVATNGMLFLAITVVLICVSPRLAIIQALGWLAVLVATWIGARKVYQRSMDYRRKEGKIADRIQEAVLRNPQEAAFSKVNYSSGHHEAALATIQGRVTLAAHLILGTATIAALAVGILGLRSGAIDIDALFIFVMYTRTMHKPGVRLARQGTRLGKVVACAERLEKLIRNASKQSRRTAEVGPLRRRLVVKGAELTVESGGETRRLLGPLDLTIPAGQRVLVIGPPGSGKTLLLEVLGGRRRPQEGRVLYDDVKMHRIERGQLGERVALARTRPSWIRKPLHQVLGFAEGEAGEEELARWRAAGFLRFVDGLPGGLDGKVAVADLSAREAREASVVRACSSAGNVVLLDEPFAALDEKAAGTLAAMLVGRSGATVVVTSREPCHAEAFDRLLVLDGGRVVEDRDLATGEVAS